MISDIFNLIISLAGVVFLLIIGWFWSLPIEHRSFHLGWLVVAFTLFRFTSIRLEQGNFRPKDYLRAFLLALPGFACEFLANRGHHDFWVHQEMGALIRFATFSCLLIVLLVVVIAYLRFGIGLDTNSAEDEKGWRQVTSITGALIATVAILGTLFFL